MKYVVTFPGYRAGANIQEFIPKDQLAEAFDVVDAKEFASLDDATAAANELWETGHERRLNVPPMREMIRVMEV